MDREKRLEILSKANEGLLVQMGDEISNTGDVTVIKEPTTGLFMMRALDPVTGDAFNLGEVLVTEAQVKVFDNIGHAIVMGRSPEKALAAAVIDAAIEGGHPLSSSIVGKLIKEERMLLEGRIREFKLTKKTAPDFDVMEG